MREKLVPLISAAVVVLLQIVIAPVIAIYSVVPNFIVAFVIVLSIVRPEDTTYVYAFVMGIISDLFTQVPFGLTPLLLLIISFALSRVFEVLDKSSIAMVLVSCAVSLLFYEDDRRYRAARSGVPGGVLRFDRSARSSGNDLQPYSVCSSLFGGAQIP